jgi:hypothetical protein
MTSRPERTADEDGGSSSAGILLLTVLDERNLRHGAIDGLGNKATALLGFDAALLALVTLFGNTWSRVVVTGLLVLATAAAFNVLIVKKYPTLNPVPLWRDYVEAEPARAERVILDTIVSEWPNLEEMSKHRAKWVTIATGVSAAAFGALVVLSSWNDVTI